MIVELFKALRALTGKALTFRCLTSLCTAFWVLFFTAQPFQGAALKMKASVLGEIGWI